VRTNNNPPELLFKAILLENKDKIKNNKNQKLLG